MGRITLENDDWTLPCSDDEISNSFQRTNEEGAMQHNILPDISDLDALYSEIEQNGSLTLEWKCPGRRAPSPLAVSNENNTQSNNQRSNLEEKSEFDFSDEVTSLRLRVRREGEDTLRGSAKKKTTSFDGIVSNMMRHKQLEQLERNATPSSPHQNAP